MVSLFFYLSLKDWLGNFRYKKSTSWCYLLKWSGKRGSNSRPRPWQGRALPTELFPHNFSDFKWCPRPDLNWHAPKGEGF